MLDVLPMLTRWPTANLLMAMKRLSPVSLRRRKKKSVIEDIESWVMVIPVCAGVHACSRNLEKDNLLSLDSSQTMRGGYK